MVGVGGLMLPIEGGRRPIGHLAACLAAAATVAGCTPRTPPSASEIGLFVGASLPISARDLRAREESGIDRLVAARFDAEAAEAETWAARIVPGGLRPGEDPGLGHLGGGLEGWAVSYPPGASGGEGRSTANRVVKLVSVPAGPGTRRFWLATFSQ